MDNFPISFSPFSAYSVLSVVKKRLKMTSKELQEKHRKMIEKDHYIEHIEFDDKGRVKALKAVGKDIKTIDLTKKERLELWAYS